PLHDAVVADLGGLGQSRGPRRVDVQRRGTDRNGRAFVLAQGFPGASRHLRIERGHVLGALSVNPARRPRGQARAHRGQPRREFAADDGALGRDDVDRMGERVAGEIVVDERDHGADARQAQPYRHVLGAVLHHQAHGVAGAQALRQTPARVLIAAKRQFPVAQRGFGRFQRGGRLESLRQPLDQQRQRDPGAVDGRGTLERADPRLLGRFRIRFNGFCHRNFEPYHDCPRRSSYTVGNLKADAQQMKRETIAIHGGFDSDPTTKAVAVPIYQTAAYTFDSAEHGAALFNLEIPGYRYSRISNPTTDVLEQRVCELEGGVAALSVSSGQTSLYYAVLNVTEMGRNIVSVP